MLTVFLEEGAAADNVDESYVESAWLESATDLEDSPLGEADKDIPTSDLDVADAVLTELFGSLDWRYAPDSVDEEASPSERSVEVRVYIAGRTHPIGLRLGVSKGWE